MSAGGQFGGSRGLSAKPPEKGVFPLDHFGECAKVKDEYLNCVSKHKGKADECTDAVKAYLNCRMQHNLMAPQDLKELGLSDNTAKASKAGRNGSSREKTKRGFIAGLQ